MNTKKQERRKRTLTRLESQLSSGVKPMKEKVLGKMKTFTNKTVPLTEKDRKRIENEIQTLKTRI